MRGQTYCEELEIDLARNTPSVLFRWLCATILFAARIRAEAAVTAARALTQHGWTTAEKMAQSSWEERTRALNQSGYARYDESTSTELGEAAALLLEEYGGDLRRLREKAGRDPQQELRLIQEFKGIGPVGAHIFGREMQIAWEELYPFADAAALDAAQRLHVGEDPKALAAIVERKDFPRLVAALARTHLAHDYDEVERRAEP